MWHSSLGDACPPPSASSTDRQEEPGAQQPSRARPRCDAPAPGADEAPLQPDALDALSGLALRCAAYTAAEHGGSVAAAAASVLARAARAGVPVVTVPAALQLAGVLAAEQPSRCAAAGPGVAENMMSGTVIIDGDASQYAGATGHGGLLVIKGNASSRCGISMKGIDIVVFGNIGHMSAFMAQSGNLVVLGDAGDALGDSLYEARLFVRGSVKSLGSDCI